MSCFSDAPRADASLVAEHAQAATESGAGVILVADTIGDLLPQQTTRLFDELCGATQPNVVFASHLHNDLGLALANTIAAIGSGVRIVSSSWLGIAERAGMVATEQLMYLLACRTKEIGIAENPWLSAPDLTQLSSIARAVSAETGVPLTVTAPIVGGGVGTISTGTPFVRPATFEPFDPQVVGIAPSVVLTHLASSRVLRAVAERVGYPNLDRRTTEAALKWVKSEAYRRNTAVVPDADLCEFLCAWIAAPDGSAQLNSAFSGAELEEPRAAIR